VSYGPDLADSSLGSLYFGTRAFPTSVLIRLGSRRQLGDGVARTDPDHERILAHGR
jgi:hypothetical protein